MSAHTQAIEIERVRIYHRGSLVPFTWAYEATCPDGERFDNSSLVEIRRVLHATYPEATITRAWERTR